MAGDGAGCVQRLEFQVKDVGHRDGAQIFVMGNHHTDPSPCGATSEKRPCGH